MPYARKKDKAKQMRRYRRLKKQRNHIKRHFITDPENIQAAKDALMDEGWSADEALDYAIRASTYPEDESDTDDVPQEVIDGIREAIKSETPQFAGDTPQPTYQATPYSPSDPYEATPLERCIAARRDVYGEEYTAARNLCLHMFQDPMYRHYTPEKLAENIQAFEARMDTSRNYEYLAKHAQAEVKRMLEENRKAGYAKNTEDRIQRRQTDCKIYMSRAVVDQARLAAAIRKHDLDVQYDAAANMIIQQDREEMEALTAKYRKAGQDKAEAERLAEIEHRTIVRQRAAEGRLIKQKLLKNLLKTGKLFPEDEVEGGV